MKKHHIITTALLILVFICLLVSPVASQDMSKKTWSLKYWVPWAKSMWQAETFLLNIIQSHPVRSGFHLAFLFEVSQVRKGIPRRNMFENRSESFPLVVIIL